MSFLDFCVHLCLLTPLLHPALTFPQEVSMGAGCDLAGASDGLCFQASPSVSIHCAGCAGVISSHTFFIHYGPNYASQPLHLVSPERAVCCSAGGKPGVLDLTCVERWCVLHLGGFEYDFDNA